MLLTRLLHKIPSRCAVCRGWGGQRLCSACIGRFRSPVARCERCALEVPPGVLSCGACLTDPPPFDRSLAGVDYAFPWGGLITQFKFKSALDLAPALAERIREAQLASDEPLPDLLLPVPLSSERLRERGFNQAWELARRLARSLQVPADPRLLLRVRNTPHQIALPPEQRAANVRGAFAVEPTRCAQIAGRSIAIVDDVMTTGATLAEIARVLRQAGARRVLVWVVARTPRPASQA